MFCKRIKIISSKVKQMYELSEMSVQQIASNLSLPKSFIYRILKKKQVKFRSLSETKMSSKNPNWKGDNVCYQNGTHRARKIYNLGPCEICISPANERHHKDGNSLNNDPSNIMILCKKCHMVLDGRIENNLYKGPHNIKRDINGKFIKVSIRSKDYPHGSYRGWRRGCRCKKCKEAETIYHRVYNKTKDEYNHAHIRNMEV